MTQTRHLVTYVGLGRNHVMSELTQKQKVCNISPNQGRDYQFIQALIYFKTSLQNVVLIAQDLSKESFKYWILKCVSNNDFFLLNGKMHFLFSGFEFLFPVTGFYCSLCGIHLTDFESTSKHMKSNIHNENYSVSTIYRAIFMNVTIYYF